MAGGSDRRLLVDRLCLLGRSTSIRLRVSAAADGLQEAGGGAAGLRKPALEAAQTLIKLLEPLQAGENDGFAPANRLRQQPYSWGSEAKRGKMVQLLLHHPKFPRRSFHGKPKLRAEAMPRNQESLP